MSLVLTRRGLAPMEPTGFEPMTHGLKVRYSTNCAMVPKSGLAERIFDADALI